MTTLLLAVALAAPAPKDVKPASPWLGEWRVESIVLNGAAVPATDCSMTLNRDGTMTVLNAGKTSEGFASSFRVDDAPSPAHLDMTVAGPNGKVYPGIVKFEKDTLTLALGLRDVRPTDFDGTARDVALYVYKRPTKK